MRIISQNCLFYDNFREYDTFTQNFFFNSFTTLFILSRLVYSTCYLKKQGQKIVRMK